MNTKIESQLRDFLAENILFLEGGGDLADDTSFMAKGVLDSLGITELVEFIHLQFGFEVPLRDIVPSNFDSIALLADYVRRRQAEGSSTRPEELVGAEIRLEPNGQVVTNTCSASGDGAGGPN
jgi:acyl carrier protein